MAKNDNIFCNFYILSYRKRVAKDTLKTGFFCPSTNSKIEIVGNIDRSKPSTRYAVAGLVGLPIALRQHSIIDTWPKSDKNYFLDFKRL
ncbi:MAG: hypothetical protein IJU65_10485 [Desulfovibrio sp.]|nr:hypothetical protein [Desulfovibrio sp.]